jgi:hypothetical protein
MAAVVALAAPALAQPSNHIGQPAAEILLVNGCTMPEADLAAAMQAEGWGISDFQAQVMALYNGGYLVSGGEGRLKLTQWGACS